MSSDINSLISAARVKPIFSDNAAQGAKGEPLERFPNKEVIDEANQKMTDVKEQAEAAHEAAIEVNRRGHDLLYYAARPNAGDSDAFPSPPSTTRSWRRAARRCRATRPTPNPCPRTSPTAFSTRPPPRPTRDHERPRREWKKNYERLIYTTQQTRTPAGPEINEIQIIQQFENEKKTYADKYRHEIATKGAVYLDPGALTQAPHMNLTAEGGRPPSAESIWYAQMNVWVQQDIARAIRR